MIRKTALLLGMTVFAVLLNATGSFAIQCFSPIVNGTGAYATTVAVASNFYGSPSPGATRPVDIGPIRDLVQNHFQNSALGANTSVTICHDSTANLLAEINNPKSTYNFGIFFAANSSAAISLEKANVNTSFLYARGVPVLFALSSTIPTVGGLITNLGSGASYNIMDDLTTINSRSINTGAGGASLVTVAGSGAPYGAKAQLILNTMMGISLPTPPAWVYPTLWGNIDQTFNAVVASGSTGVRSGFVGKSQICGGIAPNATPPLYTYVQFTDTDFVLDQRAILLAEADSANPATAAGKLRKYIMDRIVANTWNSFLTTHCYQNP